MPPDSPIFGAPLTRYLPKDGRKDFCLEGVGGGGGGGFGGCIWGVQFLYVIILGER